MADRINAQGGSSVHPVEIVPFDNENNAEKTLILLKRAIDSGNWHRFAAERARRSGTPCPTWSRSDTAGIRAPGGLSRLVERRSGLTNDKCSFWHFRFTLNSDQQTKAMISYLALKKEVKKVYLLNQDYSMGQSVEANISEGCPRYVPTFRSSAPNECRSAG